MIAGGQAYSAQDFIPFTGRTYFRLLERHYEALWPLLLLGFFAGVLVAFLVIRGNGKLAGPLLGLAWGWAGIGFLMGPYGELNWFGDYLGWSFVIQALLLSGFGISGFLNGRLRNTSVVPRGIGVLLLAVGVLVFPLISPLAGREWSGSEFFGSFPDPTVISTLGIVLISARGWLLAGLLLIPLLWCAVTGLTLHVIDARHAWVFSGAAVLVLIGAVSKTFERRLHT